MVKFTNWIENKVFDDNKDFIYRYFDIEDEDGLSLSLDTFDKKDLSSFKDGAFYDGLSDIAKNRVDHVLSKKGKTIGDLVRATVELA